MRSVLPAVLAGAAILGALGGASVAAVGTVRAPCGPGRFVRDAAGPRGSIAAYFGRRSYAAGDTALLHLAAPPGRLRVQLFHVGPEWARRGRGAAMTGVPAAPSATLVRRVRVGTWTVRIGDWPSGLYFARIAATGRPAFAPFVLRPRHLGAHRIAVVLPTNTWQAYNLLDQDHNGYGDTWYADPRVDTIRLNRPFQHQGAPPQREGFLRWATHTGRRADYLSDDDLQRVVQARSLARRYTLIVFAGHEEYVTGHVFDLIRGYRNLGGNLAFLSSNSFFGHVERHGNELTCVGHFRDEGRPEAALIGAEYLDWFRDTYRNRPYVVKGARAAPWFFRGTGLHDGDHFGSAYGVEIDARTPASPPRTRVLAELPNIFGPGKTGEMTYYRTPAGAKVFDAGAMNFDTPQSPTTERMLDNLWSWLSRP